MDSEVPKLERSCMDRIVECLSLAEHLKIRKPLPGHRSEREMLPMDGWVQVQTKDENFWIALDVKKNANPREVRIEIDYLKRVERAHGGKFYGVIGSEYLSPRVRQMCIDNGVGFVDLEGNCRLSFASVYIDKEVIRTRKDAKKQLKSLFSEKACRVLRRLFLVPNKRWDVKTLSELSGVSGATVSLVKSKLLMDEFATQEAGVFWLRRADRLLEEWAKYYRGSGESFEFYIREDLEQLEERIIQVCQNLNIMYSFTSFSGAKRIAPFIRGIQKSYLYVRDKRELEFLKEALKLKEVASGGTMKVTIPSDIDVFYGMQSVSGASTVSDIQLYLDLTLHGGRAIDSAEFLLTNRIQNRW